MSVIIWWSTGDEGVLQYCWRQRKLFPTETQCSKNENRLKFLKGTFTNSLTSFAKYDLVLITSTTICCKQFQLNVFFSLIVFGIKSFALVNAVYILACITFSNAILRTMRCETLLRSLNQHNKQPLLKNKDKLKTDILRVYHTMPFFYIMLIAYSYTYLR